jgi:hypothetical protein
MKRFLFCCLLLSATACNRGDHQEATGKDSMATLPADSAAVISDAHYFWEADLSGNAMKMKKARPAITDSLTTDAILGMLNAQYPDLKLEFIKTAGDTVFVKVGNSQYLTQKMGSTGAEAVLAELTYNLTEVSGIHNVHLAFLRGDHASPGTYSRTYFIQP